MHWSYWFKHCLESGLLTEMSCAPKYKENRIFSARLNTIVAFDEDIFVRRMTMMHGCPFESVRGTAYWNNEHLDVDRENEICNYLQELLSVASERRI